MAHFRCYLEWVIFEQSQIFPENLTQIFRDANTTGDLSNQQKKI